MKHVLVENFVIVGPITGALLVGKQRIQKGWCKHQLWDRATDSHCAMGALWDAGEDAVNYLLEALRFQHPTFVTIPDFNDNPKTTLLQILDLYDYAIAAARRDGV